MAPELLSVQVTVEALTGEADFDIESFSAMTADGREVRPDPAEDPNSDPLLKSSRFAATQSYQGWVTFTVPYRPTEVGLLHFLRWAAGQLPRTGQRDTHCPN